MAQREIISFRPSKDKKELYDYVDKRKSNKEIKEFFEEAGEFYLSAIQDDDELQIMLVQKKKNEANLQNKQAEMILNSKKLKKKYEDKIKEREREQKINELELIKSLRDNPDLKMYHDRYIENLKNKKSPDPQASADDYIKRVLDDYQAKAGIEIKLPIFYSSLEFFHLLYYPYIKASIDFSYE